MASTCFGVVGRRICRGGLNVDLDRCDDSAVILMSPDSWEKRALDSIRDRLAHSDPELTRLLAAFTRLASGEKMPVREKLRALSLRAIHRSRRKLRSPRRGPVRRFGLRLGAERIALLLWLVITVGLITTAVGLSRSGSQSACIERWPGICAEAAPAHSPPAPAANR
jgi:hypothetical protein